jgi:hypothetical protein
VIHPNTWGSTFGVHLKPYLRLLCGDRNSRGGDPQVGRWEQGDLNPHMRVSPRAPVIRHRGASHPSADPNPRGPKGRPDWSPLVYQVSLCSLRPHREFSERYPLLSAGVGRTSPYSGPRRPRNPYLKQHLPRI